MQIWLFIAIATLRKQSAFPQEINLYQDSQFSQQTRRIALSDRLISIF